MGFPVSAKIRPFSITTLSRQESEVDQDQLEIFGLFVVDQQESLIFSRYDEATAPLPVQSVFPLELRQGSHLAFQTRRGKGFGCPDDLNSCAQIL